LKVRNHYCYSLIYSENSGFPKTRHTGLELRGFFMLTYKSSNSLTRSGLASAKAYGNVNLPFWVFRCIASLHVKNQEVKAIDINEEELYKSFIMLPNLPGLLT
jgi:hypothetical protein